MSEQLAPAPENIFKHARAEIRQQARGMRGLLALDELLGELGDIEQLCKAKRLELEGLERAHTDLEVTRVALAEIEPKLAAAKQLHRQTEQLCHDEETRLDALRVDVATLERKKLELVDVERKLADAKASHAEFIRKIAG
jgi:hypothetical protein